FHIGARGKSSRPNRPGGFQFRTDAPPGRVNFLGGRLTNNRQAVISQTKLIQLRRGFMGKLDGKQVAILVADGFEQVEMVKPREALEEAGAETRIVSPKSGQIQGMHHADKGDKF